MDLRWQSRGGLLLDGNGDIAVTLSPQEELESMAATRLKASVDSWKMYRIGCNLKSFIGASVGINQDTELAIQRKVTADFANQFLPSGSFSVRTLTLGGQIDVFVYLGSTLLASTTVSF